MIKKHLIACSVLLLFTIFTKIYLGGKHKDNIKATPKKAIISKEEPKKEKAKHYLSFANEKLPVHNPKVAVRIKKAIKANKFENLQTHALHKQAAKWFPVIEPILKKYNIPEDFKYVPLVECGLERGTSHKGASGYWQFMPQTARDYGLKVNGKTDERWDIHKSTEAACRYLQSLYSEFHNWTLVAAAYNLGETRLWSQISKQKHRNYFKLKLNHETATYVYKIVSMKEIIEHPAKYGYEPKKSLLANNDPVSDKKSYIDPKLQRNALAAFQFLQN
ncbi:lytic transglycosylase domain-containing protein [Rubrolithibacter danxiaensis]|uniref:lytic transglycosylase domain-containing protein n=1 Tax=Rubrolithibacter danxiaensis TaxID=3390805 RepID=UPI003BF7D6D4